MYRVISGVFILAFMLLSFSAELYFMGNFCIVKLPAEYHIFGQYCARGSMFSDWVWLYHNYASPMLSPYIRYSPWSLLVAGMVGIGFSAAFEHCVLLRANNRTIHGKHKSQSLHGDARWAEKKEVKQAGLLDQSDGGVVVGGFDGKQLIDRSGLHVMVFAPTGTGKGVGIVTPTMLRWDQSAIVLDVKRELYSQTAGYRASKGHRVLPFDPTSEHSVRFNPLAEIRVGTKYAIADCQRIVDVIIAPGSISGDNKGFYEDAANWVNAVVLHLVYKARQEEKKESPSLRDVYMFMSMRDFYDNDTLEDDHGEEEVSSAFKDLCQSMIDYDHGDNFIDDLVVATAISMKTANAKYVNSVSTISKTPFSKLFVDPVVIKNTSTSDFTIKDLMNGDAPTTLYLLFPPSDTSRLKGLIKLLIDLFLAQTISDLDFVDGRAQSTNKYKLLLLMDEFTSIGRVGSYERALTYMRGYGVKSMVIIQNTGQFIESEGQKTYGKDNAFLPNANIVSAYSSNHPETQKLLSGMCGKTTVIQEKVSVSGTGRNKSRSFSQQEVSRDLIMPHEIGQLQITAEDYKGRMISGENLVFLTGVPPILDTMYPYFKDKDLSARTKIPPPELTIDGEIIPYKHISIKEKEEA